MSIKYNRDFNIEFDKAKKRYNDIAISTGRSHLLLDNEVARSNGERYYSPEAYPEMWTLADLVAESEYQAKTRKEMLEDCSPDEKEWIKKEYKRWDNFYKHYLPLVKEMNIELFCNHCSSLDVSREDTIFYRDMLKNILEEREV